MTALKLDRAFQELKDQVAIQEASLRKAYDENVKSLANLTKLRIRELIDDQEFEKQRHELQREQLRLREHLERMEKGENTWFEPARLIISFSNRAVYWFKEGDQETKRLIVRVVGSNLVLKDKILSIEATKPFRRWPKIPSYPELRAVVEEVRTLAEDEAFLNRVAAIGVLFDKAERSSPEKAHIKSTAS